MITKNISVPTGNILITTGDRGSLECLSIGDYGKEANIKADFLGLSREIEGVPHGALLPLEEKWVITISTQYGCSSKCVFCDVPKVGPGRNCTVKDLMDQVADAMSLHPEVKTSKRLNVHFARMGEPSWNENVLTAAIDMYRKYPRYRIHPVVSTMAPKWNKNWEYFIEQWLLIKNDPYTYAGEAGLQLSINSTNETTRDFSFGGSALTLSEIAAIMKRVLAKTGLKGRKIALNFAITKSTEIDAEYLRSLFDPTYFMCKITPLHLTRACVEHDMNTSEGYSAYAVYKPYEEALKAVGFDVIVFVPSLEEDESRITCGNAILSDKE